MGTLLRPQALTVSGGEAGLSSSGLEEANKNIGWRGLWVADTEPQRARKETRGAASTSDHFPGAGSAPDLCGLTPLKLAASL